jgi:hypothetical protein
MRQWHDREGTFLIGGLGAAAATTVAAAGEAAGGGGGGGGGEIQLRSTAVAGEICHHL